MDSKAIILDLDGTTLTSKKTVNPLLVEYLQTLRKRGLLVLIATGRTIFEIRKILPKEFKVDGIVASNGMNIFDASKQIIKKDIPSNTVQQLIDQSIEFGIHHEIYHQDGTVTAMKTPFQSETTKLKLHNFRKYIEWTSSIHTNNVEKIIFFDDHTPHVANWFENLKRMQKSLEFSAALSSSHLIDVNGAGASKATGTTLLLSKLNIAFDHVMAFGDGGHNTDLTPKAMDPARTTLYHERLRKELSNVTQEDPMSVTGTGRLEKDELVGARISEVGLLDESGYLIGYRCFSPKIKDTDETYEVEIKIRF